MSNNADRQAIGEEMILHYATNYYYTRKSFATPSRIYEERGAIALDVVVDILHYLVQTKELDPEDKDLENFLELAQHHLNAELDEEI